MGDREFQLMVELSLMILAHDDSNPDVGMGMWVSEAVKRANRKIKPSFTTEELDKVEEEVSRRRRK